MDFLFSTAYAQEAGAAGTPAAMAQFAPFVIIFIIFYFLMIRPQKKKLQEEQVMLDSLTKGDEIFTKSGIIGTIHGLTDKIITLETEGGNKLKVLRSQAGGKASAIFDEKKEK
jgi:preprotein translocase subunit YajC